MSDGGQDLEPILQDFHNLVDGFMEKHTDLKKRLDAVAASPQSSGPHSSGSSFPGPDLAQFVCAYAENQAKVFDFLRHHLDSRKVFEALAAEKAGLQSELARFSEQVMLLSKAALDASEEKGRLSLELESARREAGEARQRTEGLDARIVALENDLREVRQALAERRSELETVRAERDALRGQIEGLSNERESNRRKMEEVEATEKNLAAARGELEETRRKIGELEGRLAEVRAEDEKLRLRVEQFETENRSSRERLGGLQVEIDRLRSNTVPTHEHESVKAERDVLLDQGRSQIEKILALEKEIERRRAQFDETIAQKVDAEKTLLETEARLKSSEAKVAELQAQLDQTLSTRLEPGGGETPFESSAGLVVDRLLRTDAPPPEGDLQVFHETEISMFQTDPDRVESLALSEDRDTLDTEWEKAEEPPKPEITPEATPRSVEAESDSLVDLLDTSFGEMARAQPQQPPPEGEWDKDDSIFDEIFKDVFSNQPRETLEGFRAAVESDPDVPVNRTSPAELFQDPVDTSMQSATDSGFESVPLSPARGVETGQGKSPSVPIFPYPEITGAGMENFYGKKILLIGGDERFLSDYQHLFGLSSSDLVYFPSYSHLERNGVKRHVRDCDVVVVFGAAAEDPGIFRLRTLAEDYGRLLVNHPSSGLVSLYHELQLANAEL